MTACTIMPTLTRMLFYMPSLSLSVISVDAQDVMGSHVVDVGGTIHKTRLSPEGSVMVDAAGQDLPLDETNPISQKGEVCVRPRLYLFLLQAQIWPSTPLPSALLLLTLLPFHHLV